MGCIPADLYCDITVNNHSHHIIMRILTVLTYYRPHTSGLTIYAERLARAFARRGHQVTVMTTQYDQSLPLAETLDGVRVIRVPVPCVSARAC